MKLMSDNLQGLGGFVEGRYWSSSESIADYAWNQDFSVGNQHNNLKSFALYVRPVRAF